MGAKYAPSLANLFMAKWEEDVYAHQRPELVLWARYIDILLLWDGDEDGLKDFMESLKNDSGLVLNFEVSREEVHFLDLRKRM